MIKGHREAGGGANLRVQEGRRLAERLEAAVHLSAVIGQLGEEEKEEERGHDEGRRRHARRGGEFEERETRGGGRQRERDYVQTSWVREAS